MKGFREKLFEFVRIWTTKWSCTQNDHVRKNICSRNICSQNEPQNEHHAFQIFIHTTIVIFYNLRFISHIKLKWWCTQTLIMYHRIKLHISTNICTHNDHHVWNEHKSKSLYTQWSQRSSQNICKLKWSQWSSQIMFEMNTIIKSKYLYTQWSQRSSQNICKLKWSYQKNEHISN